MSPHAVALRPHTTIRAIVRSYLAIARRYKKTGIALLLFYMGGTILGDIVMQLYYRDIIDTVAGAAKDDAWQTLLSLLTEMTLVMIGYNVCWRAADFCMTYFQSNVLRDLLEHSYAEITRRSYAFFAGQFTGGIVAKIRRYVSAFETLHDKLVFQFWQTTIALSGVLLIFAWQMPLMAVFFVVWSIGFLTVNIIFARYRMRYDEITAEADSAVTASLSDTVTNVLTMMVFAARKREIDTFHTIAVREYAARKKAWTFTNIFFAFQATSMAILELGGLAIALLLWKQGSITGGAIVLVQFYFSMVMYRTWDIGRSVSDCFKAFANAKEFVEILTVEPEIVDPPKPVNLRISKGSIEFHSVDFHYQSGAPVLEKFSLHIPGGQKVGIVGYSGAGKSTLMKLLLRFLDVSAGSITIDGIDIRSVTQDDLRRALSFVPQEPMLFHRTLRDNIAYGKDTASDAAVIEAATRAHAHEFIERLPKGYATLVGERGIKLSGGERQRIALARVILKNAPILLLDEATSSLDSVSERYIQEELATVMEGKTTIAIAHRISTIKRMDRIVVMEQGRIVEDGSHEELLRKNGTYATLWQHQSQGFLVEEDGKEETMDASNRQ